ncbi:MAG: hypothetical protein GWM98_19055, partial [Nitrospinaceae bacterium]|nr:hypothetical protein [Nitrospinaceae bacterium]NIR56194.1 hypothetical protein [Nitrospinaceae bacterium]NIS86650.1 hypothetical protein [Nitrospinaceae bacterium]NIT83483.1 hypothetical protein [Nitrospinaceae bacterium]NIU45688.1 hypothetical protein [Nitrospinaceae bacterium]
MNRPTHHPGLRIPLQAIFLFLSLSLAFVSCKQEEGGYKTQAENSTPHVQMNSESVAILEDRLFFKEENPVDEAGIEE